MSIADTGQAPPAQALTPAQLLQENSRLQDFAHMACHDLRAPLRAMMSLTEWITEDLVDHFGALPDTIEKDLNELALQGQRMSQFLTDLLAFAVAGQAGHGRCEAEAELREAIEFCALPAGFEVVVAPGLPALAVDPVEFSMVMRNLISNAVRHHDLQSGQVQILHQSSEGRCHILVRDDGPGISAEDRPVVFEMFRTIGLGRGFGIGLGVVRKIVEHYGGRPAVAPNPAGRGTEFSLSFPLVDATGREGSVPAH